MENLSQIEAVFEDYTYLVSKVHKYEKGGEAEIDLALYLRHNPKLDVAVAKHLRKQFATAKATATAFCNICGQQELSISVLGMVGINNIFLCPICSCPYTDFLHLRTKYRKTVLMFTGFFMELQEYDKLIPLLDSSKLGQADTIFDQMMHKSQREDASLPKEKDGK